MMRLMSFLPHEIRLQNRDMPDIHVMCVCLWRSRVCTYVLWTWQYIDVRVPKRILKTLIQNIPHNHHGQP